MKKLRIICSILSIATMATCFVACSNKENSNSSTMSDSSTSSVVEVSETKKDIIYKDGVQYTEFRIFIDDSFTEKSLQSQIEDNKGIIPTNLLNNSFIVNAYYHIDENNNATTGELVIADNTTDMLHNLNNFEVNEDFTEATFVSDASSNKINAKIKVNENDEICLVLDESNIVAVQAS